MPEEMLQKLYERLQQLDKFKQFEVEISNLGFFKTRVLWVGITRGKERLEEIAKEIEKLLDLNKEEFTSHITIARNKDLGYEEFRELVEELSKISVGGKFSVQSIDVMENIEKN
jgi:2'-5' RNA ligase